MASGRPLLGSIVFLRCSERFLFGLKSDFYSRIAVYRDSARTGFATISDAEMDNFRMVVNIKGQEYIPLTITNPQFLKGSRVRVLDGPFKGAVGVVRRIKGDRRLVVSVSGICAVATSFIRPELLEPVSGEEFIAGLRSELQSFCSRAELIAGKRPEMCAPGGADS